MTETTEQAMGTSLRPTRGAPRSNSPLRSLLSMPVPQAAAIIASVQIDKAHEAYGRLSKNPSPEALHDFRVGMRQLRSTFTAYPEAFPSLPKKLRKRLRSLARDTNQARDADVQLGWLLSSERQMRGEARLGYRWLVRQLELRAAEAHRVLRVDVLEDYLTLEQQTRAVLAHNENLDSLDSEMDSLGHLCGEHLEELASELTYHLRHIETREDEDQLHAARLCGKRIRYLLTPLRAELKGSESVIRRLQRLQDLLGDYHDVQVFGDRLRRLIKKAALEQSERLLELMLNAAPDARTLGRERKQDLITGILAVARVVAKRKEKLLQQLGQLQANGAQDQLSHDIAMLAAGLQGHSETLAG
ncbi:MAG: CHAD domain-containing protein [Gammaproteobacteria bacterium]|nr:CHAD domain-containing protein [Gammaproteobacteria bacterium]